MITLKIRILAAAAGLFSGVAVLGLSWMFFPLGVLLVIGALVPGRFSRAGTWLIVAPAVLLSALIVPICVANSGGLVHDFRVGPSDVEFILMSTSWLLSPILLICCLSAILVRFAKRSRRTA